MRTGLLTIMILRHLRLRLLWLLLLCTGDPTHPLGAATRTVEPIGAIGPTLRTAAVRTIRTAGIKVCAKPIGRTHARTDASTSSSPGRRPRL